MYGSINFLPALLLFFLSTVAPEIVNNFIPFSPRPGELIVTAQNPAPAMINVSVNEVDQLVVACKGQGRPKATITWLVSIGGDTPMMINESSPNFDITVPRPGRSYINTTVNQVGCNTYFCNAVNNAGGAEGSVQVCAAGESEYYNEGRIIIILSPFIIIPVMRI